MEVRNGKMGVTYVQDVEMGWTTVVKRRRKKSVRSEKSESRGNLNVNNK